VSFDVVVAADLDWGIGKTDAPLPWPKLKGDLAHFRRVTCEAAANRRNAVVMGRKTWLSTEVSGKPLARRLNVVISRRAITLPDGVIWAASLDAAIAAARDDATVDNVFCLGGGEIYRQAFDDPGLRWTYLTRIDARFGCDITIPNLDELGFVADDWSGACAGEDNGVRYRIERLTRRPGT
jgi:dihydrofolate reductase